MVNSAYLLGAGDSSLFFVTNILLHLVLGPVAVVLWYKQFRAAEHRFARVIRGAMFITGITGLGLLIVGNTQNTQPVFWIHVLVSTFALAAALLWCTRALKARGQSIQKYLVGTITFAAVAFCIPAIQTALHSRSIEVTNPILPPLDLAGEAMGGSTGPFFPSAAETADQKLVPAEFFLESETCAESGCHADAYEQWQSSAHHFSSFNNPWYKKSIEYMQDVTGTKPAQWCAGCHDPALLFSGQMDQPVDSFINLPEATAGLACVACHSVSSVKNTMGNGGYVIEYPAMHKLANSTNRIVKTIHDLVIRANPEPHRRTFLKDFHLEQSDQFCASCHKVHMDIDVNGYRWVRGFNTYDNWQASGISGEGARSFYDPSVGRTCVDCHMPSVPSTDAGHENGSVKSHRFAAANTAIPALNADSVQLKEVTAFLSSNQLLVDIVGFSENEARADDVTGAEQPSPDGKLATQFAIGEEQAMGIGSGSRTSSAVNFIGPLNTANSVLRAGSYIRLDVVVRTLGLGHFFPTGTVDAQEAWIELKAVYNGAETIFWSGWIQDANGPVDSSAHFFRSVVLDGHGNPINKRNAFASRSLAYVNLIPPSAADVAHYRIQVPEEPGELTVSASVHYRKFNWWFNKFTFSGTTTDPDSLKTISFDDREWLFADGHPEVTLPIVTMATDTLVFRVESNPESTSGANAPGNVTDVRRLYDYGIGLFREGDLHSAEAAFVRAAALDPTNINIPINLARVALADGSLEKAGTHVEQALELDPLSPKANYFKGLYLKALGDYGDALASLAIAEQSFPKDRVVLNQIGRILFLDSRPGEAIPWFERVLRIDSEDLMAHYNLMLSNRAAGNISRADEHEKRYLRYKDDESSVALSLKYRQANPYDNNEATPIHEHNWNVRR